MEITSLDKTIFRKMTVPAIRTQTRNVDFIEIGLTGRTEFFFVRYSVYSFRKVTQERSILYEEVCSLHLHQSLYICRIIFRVL
jgi:hypothetical protein